MSTQVGCAMACAFCLTGKMGLRAASDRGRNRRPGARAGARNRTAGDAPFNIVLMGMGEPLHNYDATMKALRMLADEQGLARAAKRVTLSTVGVVPGARAAGRRAADAESGDVAARDDRRDRDRLVPINRRYDLEELIAVLQAVSVAQARGRITFEYVLLDGVNDTPDDARRLVALLDGLKAKVNLLPLNEAPGIPFRRPSDERVNEFARILADRDVLVSVRKSRGRDIRAACGQLIVEAATEPSPGQRLAGRLA